VNVDAIFAEMIPCLQRPLPRTPAVLYSSCRSSGDPHLLRTSRGSIFVSISVCKPGSIQPSTWLSTELVALRLPEAARGTPSIASVPADACIDFVTLLEVYVFKEVPADRSGGNRVALHLDSLHMRIAPSPAFSRLRRYSSILGAL